MSDPRDARKPAAPARPAVPQNRPMPPVAPVGSPRPPAVAGTVRGKMPTSPGLGSMNPSKKDSEPPVSDTAWDAADADTVTSMPDTPRVSPAAPAAKASPPPPPSPSPPPVATRPQSVPPPAVSTSPAPQLQGLSATMREEVWAIVRAAVAEATQPMIARQREIEARLERAEQAKPAAPAAPARSTGASIPVLVGPSVAPAPKVSVPPGTYGVAVLDPGPQKPAVDTSNVAPFDMPDFGGRSRMMPKVIAVVILLVVASVITMTVLSHA